MRIRCRSIITTVAILLAMLIVFANGSFYARVTAAEIYEVRTGPTLRVAFARVAGLSEVDERGNRTGILVDYLNEISKYTNWNYEYVDVAADDIVSDFLEGKFDLMGGTNYNEDWADTYFAYPKYSMGNNRATLFYLNDDNDIKGYDISSINGKTIGVYANATEKIRRLRIYLDSNNLNCNVREYSYAELMETGGDMQAFLLNGEVDLILGNITDMHENFSLFASFDDQPYYIVAQPGETQIVEQLNYALERILEINPDFAAEVYEKNVSDLSNAYVRLTDAEMEYVKSVDTLRVSMVRNWHPFYCDYNQEISHKGLVRDILDRVTEFSGLKFSVVFVDTYSDMINSVMTDNADIAGCFDSGDDAALEMGIARTYSYAKLSNTVIKNKKADFPNKSLVGGCLRKSYFDTELTDAEPVYFNTVQEGMAAVESGEIDFFSGLAASIEHEFQFGTYNNLSFVSALNETLDISFALKRPVDTQLYSVLNKSLKSISEDDKTSITNKNIVSEGVVFSISLSELIARNPIVFAMIIVSIFMILTLGIGLFIRVKYRARIMQSELEKAEARSRAKSDFLSRMSHEIRTPMNAIVGLTDLVGTIPDLPESAQKKISQIRLSSDYMLSLINDILDMSRIENDRLLLDPVDFSLHALLDEIDEMTAVLVARKGLEVVKTRNFVHDCFFADQLRLRQVIINLVSNAVKFTPTGKRIMLAADEISSDDGSATIVISVEDEGVGIAAADIERIFKAFEQAGTNITKSEGTGLGLAISSNIVRLMNGEIKVESEVGKGSRFYFEVKLPFGTETSSSETEVTEHSLDGVKVLLAEDNDINAEIAIELLSMHGAQIERVCNGMEAVEKFTESEAGYYDIILMDVKMPIMDGLQATRSIRESSHPSAATVPIIAMTANSFEEDRRMAKESGMNGFVPKPIDMRLLLSTVRDLTVGSSQEEKE